VWHNGSNRGGVLHNGAILASLLHSGSNRGSVLHHGSNLGCVLHNGSNRGSVSSFVQYKMASIYTVVQANQKHAMWTDLHNSARVL